MDSNSFHRLAKALADSGEAATIGEAQRLFANYGVRIVLGIRAITDAGDQIIALTAINTAARSFQGNVQVVAQRDTVLTAPGFDGMTLEAFLEWLGVGSVSDEAAQHWPTIEIGNDHAENGIPGAIRPWASGWRFGLGGEGASGFVFAPAFVAAGALAVSEAFSCMRHDNPYAGRRRIELSLWSLDSRDNVATPPTNSPTIPSNWMVGLGHLGQAYAWAMGFMKPARGATLYLQDIDVITKSSLSTSVLSTAHDLERKKTRIVAKWLEERGYETAIVERRFDEHQRVGLAEPRIALFGVDNAAARRGEESAGFRFIIDGGLGSGYQDFRGIRLRTFPGPSSAAILWAGAGVGGHSTEAPAYKALLAQGEDPCGVTTLATRAVGAPFVGCVAAAYVVAELVRSQIGGPTHGYVDFSLRDPEAIETDAILC